MARKVEVYTVTKDDQIVGVFHTADGIAGIHASIKNENLEYDTITQVPIGFVGTVKNNIKEFDTNFEFHPLSKRVADGYVKVPEGHKLKDEKIVPMIKQEKVEAGLDTIDIKMKAVGDDVIPKTEAELVAEGIMIQQEIDDQKQAIEDEKLIYAEMRKMVISNLGNKIKVVKA